MTMPGVQNPHCSAWLLRNASCIGCKVSPVATASIVSTERPSACSANKVQDLTASPSTCTTQAPHWLVSQPTWVPVSPRCSRSNCTKRVRPSTVAETGLPFTVRLTVFCIEPSLDHKSSPSAGGGSQPEFCSRKRLWSRRSRMPPLWLAHPAVAGEVIEHHGDDRGQPGDPNRRRQPGGGGAVGSYGSVLGWRRLDGHGRHLHRLTGRAVGLWRHRRLGRHHRREVGEKIIRHLARGSVDQTRSDLRELATDVGLNLVAQHCRL